MSKRVVVKDEGIYYIGNASNIPNSLEKEVIMSIDVKGSRTTFPTTLDDDYNNLRTYDGVGSRIFCKEKIEVTRVFVREYSRHEYLWQKLSSIKPQFYAPEGTSTFKPQAGSGCIFSLKKGDVIYLQGDTLVFPNSKIQL